MTNIEFSKLVQDYGIVMRDRWHDKEARERLLEEIIEEHANLRDHIIRLVTLCQKLRDE